MSDEEVLEISIVQVYQRAIREWQGVLDPYEWTLAMHIVDRTLGWGKTRVTISTRRFLEGDSAYGGMRMGRTKMFEALRSLEDKGLIVRHNDPSGREIKVYAVNLGWKPEMLPVPKRLKDPSATRTTPTARRTTPSATRTREKEEGEKEEVENEYPGAPEPSVPDTGDNSSRAPKEIIRAAGQTFRAARVRRAQPTGTTPKAVTQHAEALWRAALAEHHPTAMAQRWSMRQVGMVKGKAKDWVYVRQIGFADFVEWCAINWAQIMRKQFKWMTKNPPPEVPDLGFLISFLDQFADCWGDDRFREWLNSAERTEREKLLAKGFSPEEAAAEIGKRRAAEEMREENRKASEKVKLRERAAARKEQRVARMEHMPAHPQSRAAVEARRRKLLGEGFKALDPKKPTEEVDWDNVPLLDPNWEPQDERNKYL